MKDIRISEAEWVVMKVLWLNSGLTANQIVEDLTHTMWKPKTIKTMLNRLLTKKIIRFDLDGRTYKYYPLFTEKECIEYESKSFKNKVFDGSMSLMLANFIEQKHLTEKDLEELKDILNRRKE